jgi:hypothetical protein
MGSFRFDTENTLIIEVSFRFVSISLPLLIMIIAEYRTVAESL